jgi:hypothetical protein
MEGMLELFGKVESFVDTDAGLIDVTQVPRRQTTIQLAGNLWARDGLAGVARGRITVAQSPFEMIQRQGKFTKRIQR